MQSKRSAFAASLRQTEQMLPFLDLKLMQEVAEATVMENDTSANIVQIVDVTTCSRKVQGGWPGHSHLLRPDLSIV